MRKCKQDRDCESFVWVVLLEYNIELFSDKNFSWSCWWLFCSKVFFILFLFLCKKAIQIFCIINKLHSRHQFCTLFRLFSILIPCDSSEIVDKILKIERSSLSTGCPKIKLALGYLTIVSTPNSRMHSRGPNRF